MSDNGTHLLIKYKKSVLWRVAKRLSYIEDARCLKVNIRNQNFVLVLCSCKQTKSSVFIRLLILNLALTNNTKAVSS